MKPKLIKIPFGKANFTDSGLLIKLNDKLFVLVEGYQDRPDFSVGDKIYVKQYITGIDILRPDLTISFNGWSGYIWSVNPPATNNLGDWSYQIRWDNNVFESLPEICKLYCEEEGVKLDELHFLSKHLALDTSYDNDVFHRDHCNCCGCSISGMETRFESAWGEVYCLDCACIPPITQNGDKINRQPIFLDILLATLTDTNNEGYAETTLMGHELDILKRYLYAGDRSDWSLVIEDWSVFDSILFYNEGCRKITITYSFGGNVGTAEFEEDDVIVIDNPVMGNITSPVDWESADDKVWSDDERTKAQELINSRLGNRNAKT